MEIVGFIPARMASSRFPGKPLAKILDKPMIQHIWERSKKCKQLDEVYITTPDKEIKEASELFGAGVIMTSDKHRGCLDRITEAASNINCHYVVLIQGDEPLITAKMIKSSIRFDACCTNLVGWNNNIYDENIIKVLLSLDNEILLMTRKPIMTPLKQVCIMGFPKVMLERYKQLKPTPAELSESIDMNRLLENGYRIQGIPCKHKTHAVDIPGDIPIVEKLMKK